MATLTGNAINTSYQGLLKTADNAVLGATGNKIITDGEGNEAPLGISQSSIALGSQTEATTVELFSSNMTVADQGATNGFTVSGTNVGFAGAVDFSGATVTGLPSGGGDTLAAIRAQLPAVPNNTFGNAENEDGNWRAHVSTTGYALRNLASAANLGNIGFVIYQMSPGEKLNKLRFNISTAGSAGSFINLAIYDLTYRSGGGVGQWSSGIVCNDLVKDLGQVATDSTGVKTIDIETSPYTMPTDSTWGAIAIAWATGVASGGDTAASVSGWDNDVWDGNGANPVGTTVYRGIGPYYDYGLTAPYALPSNLSSPTLRIKSDTGDPFWSLIQTSF